MADSLESTLLLRLWSCAGVADRVQGQHEAHYVTARGVRESGVAGEGFGKTLLLTLAQSEMSPSVFRRSSVQLEEELDVEFDMLNKAVQGQLAQNNALELRIRNATEALMKNRPALDIILKVVGFQG